MKYPKIYLALDTCFAKKRWITPEDFIKVISDVGFKSVEASFDNEIDMLYTTEEYKKNWLDHLKKAEDEYGTKVVSFFTGYQPYQTVGLCHPDEEYVNYFVDNWIKRAIDIMEEKDTAFGFSLHAVPEPVMQDPEAYQKLHQRLYQTYSDIGAYAKDHGGVKVCVEAMYTPQHTPWTIEGTKDFLKNIYAIDQNPIYTTVDVGHMTGQVKFHKPTKDEIKEDLEEAKRQNTTDSSLWLGSDSAYEIFKNAVETDKDIDQATEDILEEIKKYPYQFSVDQKDQDPYAWAEELACYSPIMHLQQTDNKTAVHSAFTEENNKEGIIEAKKLLEAIKRSYDREAEEGMPPKTEKIVMALELMVPNTAHPRDILKSMRETREYWEQFIPEDGLYLDELLERLEE